MRLFYGHPYGNGKMPDFDWEYIASKLQILEKERKIVLKDDVKIKKPKKIS